MKVSVFSSPLPQTTFFSVYRNIIIRLYLVASVLSSTVRWLTLNGVTDDGKNYLYFYPGKVSWKGPSISKLGGNNFFFFSGHDKRRRICRGYLFIYFLVCLFFCQLMAKKSIGDGKGAGSRNGDVNYYHFYNDGRQSVSLENRQLSGHRHSAGCVWSLVDFAVDRLADLAAEWRRV